VIYSASCIVSNDSRNPVCMEMYLSLEQVTYVHAINLLDCIFISSHYSLAYYHEFIFAVMATCLSSKYNLPIKVCGSNSRGFYMQLYTGAGAPQE
jgi:hypothetical protein